MSASARSGPRCRLGRRFRFLAALTAALASLALVPATAGAQEAPTCPTGFLAFTSQLTNGDVSIGSVAKSTGNTVEACGALKNQGGTLVATVTKDDIHFAPSSTKVLLLSLPTTMEALGDLSGPMSFIYGGGANISLSGPIQATAELLGSKCTIGPITPTLTTQTSGSLIGTPITNQGGGVLTGKVVANDFAVPAIKPSSTCPSFIAFFTNLVLGLPLAPGKSAISFDVSITIGV